MKKYFCLIVLASVTLVSCEYFQKEVERKPQTNESRVSKVSELEVFILAEPLVAYDVIDSEFALENYLTEMAGETKNGKLGNVLGGMLSRSIERADLSKMITEVASNVKTKYPEAQAIIFTTTLTKCKVVKFKSIQ